MFTKTASRIHTEISKERFAMKNILLSVLIFLASVNAKAEINLIPFQYGSENKTTIPTVHWSKADSKAVVIFLPGGSGSFGVTKRVDAKPNWLLADLYKLSGVAPLDLVFMDSHSSLQADFGDSYFRWAARRDPRHIELIKASILYYLVKTNKPVFLLGHSNGSLSIAEFLKTSPEHQKLLAGVIFSGSRNETELKTPLALPVLVIHHRSDSNRWTTPRSAESLFASVKRNNASMTELAWVEGGRDVAGGDPTHPGRHMYHEATEEAAEIIQNFIARIDTK